MSFFREDSFDSPQSGVFSRNLDETNVLKIQALRKMPFPIFFGKVLGKFASPAQNNDVFSLRILGNNILAILQEEGKDPSSSKKRKDYLFLIFQIAGRKKKLHLICQFHYKKAFAEGKIFSLQPLPRNFETV